MFRLAFLLVAAIQGLIGGLAVGFGLLSIMVIFWLFKVSLLYGVVGLLLSEVMPLIILVSLILKP